MKPKFGIFLEIKNQKKCQMRHISINAKKYDFDIFEGLQTMDRASKKIATIGLESKIENQFCYFYEPWYWTYSPLKGNHIIGYE